MRNPMHSLIVVLSFLVTLVTLGGAGSPAFADPPRASHDHWRNTNYPSHYVMYDSATRTYVETVDCRVMWRFTLVSNEMNNLTLYDASRGMTVLLNYDGMFLKPAGAANFSLYQNGTFDTRTMFDHIDANGAHTGTVVKRHGCRWEEWFPGGGAAAFTFVQGGADVNAVEMYDGSRSIWVRLETEGRMYLKQGGSGFNFFKNGRWRW